MLRVPHHRAFSARIGPLPGMLALLLLLGVGATEGAAQTVAPAADIDSVTLRTLDGRWCQIITDLPASKAVDALPAAVEAVVPQWIAFWQRPADCVDGWKMTVYLMGDREPFRRRGLMPKQMVDFPHGFQSGRQAWAVSQPSEYFTRHLVLHEVFHGFAAHVFGGVGPTWFGEGTAEMMATHKGEGATTRVPTIPASREAVPYWGRFKLITQRREQARLPSLEAVLGQRERLYVQVEPYAWSWAATVLMTMYPEYRAELTAASQQMQLSAGEFTRAFENALQDQWPVVRGRWHLLLEDFDYGYDMSRNRIDWAGDQPVWDRQSRRVAVAAARGWQSAGVRVAAGTKLNVTAAGRYSLGTQPRPWICEPQGVTVRYHRGRPLGVILAALVPQRADDSKILPPLQIEEIGRSASFVVRQDSWLLFRIGDDPSQLDDNSGGATVSFRLQP